VTASSKLRGSIQWVFAGNVVGKILEFAFGVALARLLVPADFGMVVTIQIFTGVVGLVAGGGLGQALVQAKVLKEKDFNVVFTWQLLISVLIFLSFYLIAPYFAVWFEDPLYAPLLQVSAFTFLLRPFINTMQAKLGREMRFQEAVYIGTVRMLCVGVVSVMMALTGFGVWSLVLSGLCGGVLNMAMLYWRTRLRLGICFEKDAAKRLGAYGVRLSGCDILNHIRDRLPGLFVSKALGASALGIYNKADSLAFLPMGIIGTSAFYPVFRAAAEEQDNLDKVKYIYYRAICLVSVYTLPFYVGLWWVAESFVVNVYGTQWTFVVTPLMIFVLTGPLNCVGNPSAAVTRGMGCVGQEFRILLETITLLVVACLIGVKWGIEGIAWASISALVYHSFRMINLALGAIQGRLFICIRQLIPAAILNSTLFVVLFLTDYILNVNGIVDSSWLYMFIMVIIGGGIYGVMFLFFPVKALATESQKWRVKLKLASPMPINN